jgi:hypothetical protein
MKGSFVLPLFFLGVPGHGTRALAQSPGAWGLAARRGPIRFAQVHGSQTHGNVHSSLGTDEIDVCVFRTRALEQCRWRSSTLSQPSLGRGASRDGWRVGYSPRFARAGSIPGRELGRRRVVGRSSDVRHARDPNEAYFDGSLPSRAPRRAESLSPPRRETRPRRQSPAFSGLPAPDFRSAAQRPLPHR